jgi:hypothetical protein
VNEFTHASRYFLGNNARRLFSWNIFGFSEHIARLGSKYRRDAGSCLSTNLVGDHRPLTIHAEKTQLIAVTMKVHYALIDSFRAIPKIETEQLATVVIAVRTVDPQLQKYVGLIRAKMFVEECGRTSAIEDVSLQEAMA